MLSFASSRKIKIIKTYVSLILKVTLFNTNEHQNKIEKMTITQHIHIMYITYTHVYAPYTTNTLTAVKG